MFYKLFPLLIFLFGCREPRNHSKKIFQDIDIFTLKGIGKTDADQFPNVEVLDSANLRVLKYNVNEDVSFERVYHRLNGNWVTSFSYKDDTTTIYTKRIISPDKCLEFSYTDTLSYRIFDVGIFERDSMVFFNSEKALFLEPRFESIKEAKENSRYQTIYQINANDVHVKITKKTMINHSGDIDIYTRCYSKSNRSFFWWMEMKDYLNDLDCINN